MARRFHYLACLCIVVFLTKGCSQGTNEDGGGLLLGLGVIDNGQAFGGNSGSVAKYRDNITSDEAYHLLRRAAFGATPEQVDAAVQKGLSATVDDLLREKQVPATVRALSESFEHNMAERWLVYLLESPNPLREKMALFWHDRFATSRRVLKGRDAGLAVLHLKMLRSNALGNYRDFLQQLTLDPLMLLWLNGENSPKSNPNENYAREFWELFTLGRDTLYTEQDIKESARAFTGISLLRETDLDARPIFDLLNHDETTKSVFPGRAAPSNYDYISIIDLTLAQPEAAEYVARNLFVAFVHDQPTNALVRDLAQGFSASGFDLSQLVRRILLSQAMFSQAARKTYITSPVEHVVGIARTLDVHMQSEESQTAVLTRLARDLKSTGHELMNPPGVEGWGENTAWLSDQSILNRVRAIGRVMEMEFGPDSVETLPFQLLPPESTWDKRETRGEIVDAMAKVFHLSLTENERQIYIEVLDQNGWRALHLEEPDRRARHVGEMIRLMAMHEGAIGR